MLRGSRLLLAALAASLLPLPASAQLLFRLEASVWNGERLRLYVRDQAGHSSVGDGTLVEADLWLGEEGQPHRYENRPSQLDYRFNPLNGERVCVVTLDPPLGEVHQLRLESSANQNGAFCSPRLHFLNQLQQPIRTETVQYSERVVSQRMPAGEEPGEISLVLTGMSMCGSPWENWGTANPKASLEYAKQRLSIIVFRDGELILPDQETVEVDIIERILMPPDGSRSLLPVQPGALQASRQTRGMFVVHNYILTQNFTDGQDTFQLQFNLPQAVTYQGVPVDPVLSSVSLPDTASATLSGPDTFLRYYACGMEQLALFQITAQTEAGDMLTFYHRYGARCIGAGSTIATLARAEIQLGGQTWRVTDYWSLLHAFEHHNWNERFAARLDPPMGNAHYVTVFDDLFGVIEQTQSRQSAALLDERLNVIQTLAVTRYTKTLIHALPPLDPAVVTLY